MLHYRPFESWVHDSEWQVELPVGEEAEALAAGERFVAVSTSQRTLRILSETGKLWATQCLQKYIMQWSDSAMQGMPFACRCGQH